MRKVVYCSKLESLEGKGMLVKNEGRVVHIKYQYVNIFHGDQTLEMLLFLDYNSIQHFRENSLSIFVCKLQWAPETGVLMTFRFHHN